MSQPQQPRRSGILSSVMSFGRLFGGRESSGVGVAAPPSPPPPPKPLRKKPPKSSRPPPVDGNAGGVDASTGNWDAGSLAGGTGGGGGGGGSGAHGGGGGGSASKPSRPLSMEAVPGRVRASTAYSAAYGLENPIPSRPPTPQDAHAAPTSLSQLSYGAPPPLPPSQGLQSHHHHSQLLALPSSSATTSTTTPSPVNLSSTSSASASPPFGGLPPPPALPDKRVLELEAELAEARTLVSAQRTRVEQLERQIAAQNATGNPKDNLAARVRQLEQNYVDLKQHLLKLPGDFRREVLEAEKRAQRLEAAWFEESLGESSSNARREVERLYLAYEDKLVFLDEKLRKLEGLSFRSALINLGSNLVQYTVVGVVTFSSFLNRACLRPLRGSCGGMGCCGQRGGGGGGDGGGGGQGRRGEDGSGGGNNLHTMDAPPPAFLTGRGLGWKDGGGMNGGANPMPGGGTLDFEGEDEGVGGGEGRRLLQQGEGGGGGGGGGGSLYQRPGRGRGTPNHVRAGVPGLQRQPSMRRGMM